METERLWNLFQVDQKRMGALDTGMTTIRAWTITVIATIAGISLSQHHRSLLLVAVVGTVLFGLLDVRVTLGDVTRAGVLAAVEEFDRLGRDAFLKATGFGPVQPYFLQHDGELYDSDRRSHARQGEMINRYALAQRSRPAQNQLRRQVSHRHLDRLPDQRCMTGH